MNAEANTTAVVCTVTERQAIERERAAFVTGASYQWQRGCGYSGDWAANKAAIAARELYPLPKVKRQRVVNDRAGISYRAIDGFIEWQLTSDKWCRYSCHGAVPIPTSERVKLWADLLANPTEEVDA